MTNAPIKALAPWAGGKRKLAKRIVELLGPHDAYYEPFVGGCSILLAKPRSRTEAVYDANPRAIGAIGVIRDNLTQLQELLANVEFDRDEFDMAVEALTYGWIDAKVSPNQYVQCVANQLIVWWMGRNGEAGIVKSGKPSFGQRHTKTGGCPKVRWTNFKASLPSLSERLQGVTSQVADFKEVLLAWYPAYSTDADGTAIYIDSPYFSKTFRYEHDFEPIDHERLAGRLNSYRRARVVVSYRAENSTEESWLDTHYPRSLWRRVLIEQAKAMAHASGTTKRNTEVLLINDMETT